MNEGYLLGGYPFLIVVVGWLLACKNTEVARKTAKPARKNTDVARKTAKPAR
ncbi:hypothetical protein ACI2OX_03520 [Bacillus sp. N9]